MTIQLQARKHGVKEWGIRSAFISDNKEVIAHESNPNLAAGSKIMTREKLMAKAAAEMNKWINSGTDYDTEFRIVDTATLPKEERRLFERGR